MKKTVLSRLIISALSIGAILALVLFTSCADSNHKKVRISYATDYDSEVKEDVYTENNWRIYKTGKKPGDMVLVIDNIDKYRTSEPKKCLTYLVYDSVSSAKDTYDELYKECKGDSQWEEGENWFISYEPGVCDAIITWMVCRKGNIIIEAELSMVGDLISDYDYASEADEKSETTKAAKFNLPSKETLNTFPLTYYIINNTSKIRHYVLDVILKEKPVSR